MRGADHESSHPRPTALVSEGKQGDRTGVQSTTEEVAPSHRVRKARGVFMEDEDCEADGLSCLGDVWSALVEFTDERGFVRALGDDMRIFGMVVLVSEEGGSEEEQDIM